MSLLGGVLLDGEVFDEVNALVTADDFYKESHRHIFRAMVSVNTRSEALDLITVTQQLQDEKRLEAAGGLAYIAGLPSQVPTAANVSYYAGIVRKKAVLRRVIALAGEMAEECYGDVGGLEEFLGGLESRLFALSDNRMTTGYRSIKDVAMIAFNRIETLYEQSADLTGVPSGFVDLDKITAGWQPSDLIIVAARPAMGKTAFTLNIACNASVRFNRSVLFCSLEMSAEQLAVRLMASEARIDVSRMRTGQLKEQEWERLMKAVSTLAKSSLFIDDSASLSPQVLASRARRLKAEHGLDLIIIDYLQLMETLTPNINSREQQIGDISRKLKMLAKDLHVPVIALAQLNRGVEQRADKRPMMSDLRESGAIEQDADIISFVYRDEYYNEDSEDKGLGEIILGKHRSGSTGTVKLKFFPQYTRFENLARDEEEPF